MAQPGAQEIHDAAALAAKCSQARAPQFTKLPSYLSAVTFDYVNTCMLKEMFWCLLAITSEPVMAL